MQISCETIKSAISCFTPSMAAAVSAAHGAVANSFVATLRPADSFDDFDQVRSMQRPFFAPIYHTY
jgi:hypothetical protein